MIKIWLGLKNYKSEKKFISWVFTIAHNTIIDNIRKQKNLADIEEIEMVAQDNLQQKIEIKETNELINNMLGNLSEKQKEVFLLRQHSGLAFKEISNITGEPLNTVISHMHYAVKKIRKNLKDKYEIAG